jgi:hypothetical protein
MPALSEAPTSQNGECAKGASMRSDWESLGPKYPLGVPGENLISRACHFCHVVLLVHTNSVRAEPIALSAIHQ